MGTAQRNEIQKGSQAVETYSILSQGKGQGPGASNRRRAIHREV